MSSWQISSTLRIKVDTTKKQQEHIAALETDRDKRNSRVQHKITATTRTADIESQTTWGDKPKQIDDAILSKHKQITYTEDSVGSYIQFGGHESIGC